MTAQPPPNYRPPRQGGSQEYRRVFRGQMGSYLKYPQGENDKLLAGLSYIVGWIVSLIALVAIKPLSPYLRFHAIQALVIQLIYMGFAFVTTILLYVLIGILLLPFLMGLGIYIFVIGIIVLMGKDHRVPFLADWVEKNYV